MHVGMVCCDGIGNGFQDGCFARFWRRDDNRPLTFADRGEPAFRREESLALVRSLRRDHIVIALGGGAPEVLTNRLLIEQTPATCVLLLHAEFPTLFDRCTLQSLEQDAIERPNLADPVAARTRYEQRLPFYRRLATLTIETTSLSSAETVASALALLHPSLA